MSVKFLEARDLIQFGNDIADNSPTPPVAGGSFSGTLHIAGGESNGVGDCAYLASRDKYVTLSKSETLNEGTIRGIYALDPGLTKTTSPDSLYRNDGVYNPLLFFVTQVNDASQQKLYTASSSSVGLREVSLVDLAIASGDSFNGPNGVFTPSTSDIASSADGGWSTSTIAINATIFDGLTDGIPGETLNQGVNIYPDGLYLVTARFATLNGSTTELDGSFIWVDIRTRRAVGRLGGGLTNPFVPSAFPAEVAASPVGGASEAPIGGDEFFWTPAQYLPDADATHARPKGILLQHSAVDIPNIGSNPTNGTLVRVYIRLTEFNPFGVVASAQNIARTHGRVRQTTRITANVAPMFGLATQTKWESPNRMAVRFDPLRLRFVMFMTDNTGADPGGTGVSTIGFFSQAVDPVIFTSPVARDVPRTNDVTEFETYVSGDLNEPVASVSVAWTLDRRTTKGEVLTGAFTPSSTSTVANAPIDDSSPSQNEGTLVVKADGVPLAETTDYTVVLSTGVITWVTDQSGAAIVTADYEHRTTGASPAHGTLLSSVSSTDADGLAVTQVQFPDDDSLVGQIDNLDAAQG